MWIWAAVIAAVWKGVRSIRIIFQAVAKVLQEEFTPEKTMLIVEPGISLLSKASTFVTGVVDVRDIGNERYLITDGSRFNIEPDDELKAATCSIWN